MQHSTDRKKYLKAYKLDYRNRVKSVTISVPIADYNRLAKAAHKEGYKPTTLLYELAFSQFDKTIYVPIEIRDGLKELRFLLHNVANNINQLAHHANTVRQVMNPGAIAAELKKLDRAMTSYTLGRLTKTEHDHQEHV